MVRELSNGVSCPQCGKQVIRAYRPFCSARCKMIDLARWLGGAYRLPSEDEPDEAEIIDLVALTRVED